MITLIIHYTLLSLFLDAFTIGNNFDDVTKTYKFNDLNRNVTNGTEVGIAYAIDGSTRIYYSLVNVIQNEKSTDTGNSNEFI